MILYDEITLATMQKDNYQSNGKRVLGEEFCKFNASQKRTS